MDTLKGPTNRIWALAFAPDGRLFSCSEDWAGIVWDPTKKQAPRRFESFFDVSVSSDGRQVVSAFPARRESVFYLQLLDAFSLKELFRVAFPRELLCAALSIDGKHLVAGGSVGHEEARRPVLVWDWRSSTQPRILGRHDSTILDIQFSRDGRHLASAGEDGTVKVWDATRLSEAQEGRTLWPKSAQREMPRIAFSPDSKRLASGDGFNDVVVLEVETGALALPRLRGHGDMVTCVAFSPNEKFLASAGADNTVRLWDARSGTLLRTYFGHTSVINAVAFSPDSRILASGGQDQTIKLWRVDAD
jgi:WD40 repeat protein